MKARSATIRRLLVSLSVTCIAAAVPFAALASNHAGGGG